MTVNSRITTLASNNQILNYLLRTQNRMHDTQVQIATQKVSQDYTGVADDSQRLLNLENKRDLLDKYNANNTTMELRLNTATTVIQGIETSIKDFKDALSDFKQEGDFSETKVDDIQDWAFRSLQAMDAYLNTEIDGRYLFSGSRTNTGPIDLGLTNLATFQTTYDGETHIYPPTRDGHIAADVSITASATSTFTFANATGRLTASANNTFDNIPIGASVTITGTTNNNGTYTVTNKDTTNGAWVALSFGDVQHGGTATTSSNATTTLTDEGPLNATANLAMSSWYDGDGNSLEHRVDDNRSFTYDVKATDPAFEKAIRAMGIIAQGGFGTTGGLDHANNQARVDEAMYLLEASLDAAVAGTPPYGTEVISSNFNQSIEETLTGIGFDQVLLKNTSSLNTSLRNFFDASVNDIENVDPLEAITRLLDDEQALEAAYQATARIRALSLSDFIR